MRLMHRVRWLCASAVVVCAIQTAHAEVKWTLEETLAEARREAPRVRAARTRISEARARLLAAGRPLIENPEVGLLVGPRFRQDETTLDGEVSIEQWLTPGRSARLAVGRASMREAEVQEASERAELLRAVGVAFLELWHAQEKIRLTRAALEADRLLLAAAEKRFAAGDVPALDRNLVRLVLAQTEALEAEAVTERALAARTLSTLLGRATADVVAVHTSHGRPVAPLASLLAAAAARPGVEARRAELASAAAEGSLASARRWPELGLRAELRREDEADIIEGGLSLRLPLFDRGQELAGVSAAREARGRIDLAAAEQAALLDVRAAYDRFVAASRTAEAARTISPVLEESEGLARRTLEAGELSLPAFLAIRRELLQARRHELDAALRAGVAELDLLREAGVLR